MIQSLATSLRGSEAIAAIQIFIFGLLQTLMMQ